MSLSSTMTNSQITKRFFEVTDERINRNATYVLMQKHNLINF
jgi:uncharacterized membrane protein